MSFLTPSPFMSILTCSLIYTVFAYCRGLCWKYGLRKYHQGALNYITPPFYYSICRGGKWSIGPARKPLPSCGERQQLLQPDTSLKKQKRGGKAHA